MNREQKTTLRQGRRVTRRRSKTSENARDFLPKRAEYARESKEP